MLKSGEKGLVGPGSNNYGIQDELTSELADKIWKGIQKKKYDAEVSKKEVLHHLKQLKAQMGKLTLIKYSEVQDKMWQTAVRKCMEIIDKKIAKVNNQ